MKTISYGTNLEPSRSMCFSTFFTNHLASAMHRYWEASYPDDYKKNIQDPKWINKYKYSQFFNCYFCRITYVYRIIIIRIH